MVLSSYRRLFRSNDSEYSLLLRVIDVAGVAACGLLAYAVRFSNEDFLARGNYPEIIAVGLFLSLFLLPVLGVYQLRVIQNLTESLARIILATGVLFGSLVVILWAVKASEDYSRV